MVSMASAGGHRSAMAEAGNQLESLSKDFTSRAQKTIAIVLAKYREEMVEQARLKHSSWAIGNLGTQACYDY